MKYHWLAGKPGGMSVFVGVYLINHKVTQSCETVCLRCIGECCC